MMQCFMPCPAFPTSRQNQHQPGKPVSTSGTTHRSSSSSGSTRGASPHPRQGCKAAVKAPLLPLLGGPKFSCCHYSQNKQPAFCSRNEAGWVLQINVGAGRGQTSFPSCSQKAALLGQIASHSCSPMLGNLRRPLSHTKALSCSSLSQTLYTWNIPASRAPFLQLHQSELLSLAIRQCGSTLYSLYNVISNSLIPN